MNRRSLLFVAGLSVLCLCGLAVGQDQGIQAVIGNVFLQNTTPGTSQAGHANISGTFRAGQVFVQQGSKTTIPVVGNSTAVGPGTAIGGSFSSGQLNGTGVRGTSTAPSQGAGTGVLGETRSSDGYGVVGRNVSTGANGEGAGILGESLNADIAAIRGVHTTGPAIQGITEASSNAAVSGTNNGTGRGVSGFGRVGVSGSTSAGGEIAGEFVCPNLNGVGVKASISGGQNGSAVAVWGLHTSATGFAVFATGRFGASGTKNFMIDHPADPANKTLSHYCTEGSEPLNVYSGSTRTDARGYATVRLPDYYSSINRDARIQLTVVDEGDSASFVQAKVVRKVQGNRFTIRTSGPNVEVFWRVEAVRNDRWVQKHGAPVEIEKDEMMRGYYIQPDLYGLPESMGRQGALEQYNLRRKTGGRP